MAAPQRRAFKVFANPEKQGHGAGGANDDPFAPGIPSRMLFVGPPGSGKRSAVFNMLETFSDPPVRIIVVHGAGGSAATQEYRGITKDIREPENLPTFEELVGKDGEDQNSHKLIICDEINYKALKKDVRERFERLMNHTSTHATTSLMFCAQQFHSIPANIRRGFQIYTLFKAIDLRELSDLSLRLGLDKALLKELMTEILVDRHDSLLVDTTIPPDQPGHLRLNLFTPIEHKR